LAGRFLNDLPKSLLERDDAPAVIHLHTAKRLAKVVERLAKVVGVAQGDCGGGVRAVRVGTAQILEVYVG
jgi:hypothetical protein